MNFTWLTKIFFYKFVLSCFVCFCFQHFISILCYVSWILLFFIKFIVFLYCFFHTSYWPPSSPLLYLSFSSYPGITFSPLSFSVFIFLKPFSYSYSLPLFLLSLPSFLSESFLCPFYLPVASFNFTFSTMSNNILFSLSSLL